MHERKNPRQYTCGRAVILEISRGKWKPAIIFARVGGSGDLQRMIPQARRWVVNQPLKELEGHGIITKKIYPVLPPKVEYFLKELPPITQAIEAWGSNTSRRLRKFSKEKCSRPRRRRFRIVIPK